MILSVWNKPAVAVATIMCALTATSCLAQGRADGDTPFSVSDLQYGVRADPRSCAAQPDAVWVEHRYGSECIHYFPSDGLVEGAAPASVKVAVLYFHGDHLAGSKPLGDYDKITPNRLIRNMQGYYKQFHVPYILIGRPGVYGSSGNHAQRRRIKESWSLNAAVDAIKLRYGIDKVVLAGQSGGAYTTASLLTLGRTDVPCAVPSSGVYAVAELAEIKRAKSGERPKPGCDVTNYCDPYDLIDHVDGIVADPQRMIYMVSNPHDRNTVFSQQKKFADKVAAAGHRIEIIEAEGRGPEGHSLSHISYPLAGACAAGLDPHEVLERLTRPKTVAAAPGSVAE